MKPSHHILIDTIDVEDGHHTYWKLAFTPKDFSELTTNTIIAQFNKSLFSKRYKHAQNLSNIVITLYGDYFKYSKTYKETDDVYPWSELKPFIQKNLKYYQSRKELKQCNQSTSLQE